MHDDSNSVRLHIPQFNAPTTGNRRFQPCPSQITLFGEALTEGPLFKQPYTWHASLIEQ